MRVPPILLLQRPCARGLQPTPRPEEYKRGRRPEGWDRWMTKGGVLLSNMLVAEKSSYYIWFTIFGDHTSLLSCKPMLPAA